MNSRRQFLQYLGWGSLSLTLPQFFHCTTSKGGGRPPNIIIIYCDDLGYGDIGIFGHPTIRTPHVDRMAAEGQKWTSFYTAVSVCTPSRAALLTGRYPIRSGLSSSKRDVFFPDSSGGMPPGEITLAEVLKTQGYSTGCVGKWHLGHLPPHLPTRNGFDSYFGVPYSNDMDRTPDAPRNAFQDPKSEYWDVPLMRDEEIIEQPAIQETLTRRYTEEAVRFIQSNRDHPFFLYFAHTFPHVPLFASENFKGKSPRGLYGDVVEEIDWSTGKILEALGSSGIDQNTLIVFSSDNGPWLTFREQGGSAGLLHGGKRSTWEGGMRVPTIFRWPGKIKPGVVSDIGCTMDMFTTAALLGGAGGPGHRWNGPAPGPVRHRSKSPRGPDLLQGEPGLCCPQGPVQDPLRHQGWIWIRHQG